MRSQKHVSTSIVFHKPADRSKSELVYANNYYIQDVLNAWAVFQSTENGHVSVNNGNETPQSSEYVVLQAYLKQVKR